MADEDKTTGGSGAGTQQQGQQQQNQPVHPSRDADTHPDQVIKGGEKRGK